ncbi:MAG: repeat containing protein [Myxococcales bacterium]|nr:repeat containing protein [Myxococcales bacterium]
MLRDTVPRMLTQAILLGTLLLLPDDALVDDGSRKLQANDADGAIAAFDQAKKQSPKDPRPHYLSAVALQKKGDPAAAERELKAALTLDPKLAEVRNELGALLNERRRFADATVELKRAVADKPDLTEAWFNLGQAAAMQKDCATALDAYAHALKLSATDADGTINASVAARRCGKLDQATAWARQGVKLAGSSAQAHLNLGITLDAAGKLDDAVAEYTVATRIKPDYATAWWSLGLAEQKRHKMDAAIAALDKARTLSPTAARSADLGVAWRDKGDLAKAATLFREALQKDPRYTPARWHLAQTLSAQHKCGDLAKELGQLPAAEGQSAAAQKLRAACK